MYWLILLIVGLVLSWPVAAFLAKDSKTPGGWVGILIASLIGAWLGDIALGDWGWMLQGYNVIAGVIGAVIIAAAWTLATRKPEKAAVSK